MLRGTNGSVTGRRGGGQRFVYGGQSIGGVRVGSPGAVGTVYENYTMQGGDDFDGPLDVVRQSAPLAKYFTTRNYGNGGRLSDPNGALKYTFDADPYITGSQDSNRGVVVDFGNMTQANSILSIKNRIATSGEQLLTGGRQLLSGMIHTSGCMTVTPPCVIEYRISHSTATPPSGWHPTVWLISDNPVGALGSPSLEFDFPEAAGAGFSINTNVNGASGWTGNTTPFTASTYCGNGFHKYTCVITAASVIFLIDDVEVKRETHDGTVCGKPYQLLLTAHTYASTFGSDAGVNLSQWTSAGSTGVTISMDWFRIWVPTANAQKIVRPLLSLPTQQIDYGTSISYTFPTATALWGSAITDYPRAFKNEDFEPGCPTDLSTAYAQFPPGPTYNSGTRTWSGNLTNPAPGRLHLGVSPNVSGGVIGVPARGYIDVGPTVTLPPQTLVNGVPFSVDLYPYCPCGILLPKTISVGTLPTGLTFSGTTISGTPTVNATTSVPITVTNSNGQTATVNISFAVSSAQPLIIDGTPVTNTASSATTLTTTAISTTKTNNMLVLFFTLDTASGKSVTSITSTSGLTFTKRTESGVPTGGNNMQMYTAPAPSVLTNETVTITFSAATNSRSILCAVAGVGSTAAPFDTDASLPAVTTGATIKTLSRTISTQYANDITFAMLHSTVDMGTITPPSGYTQLLAINNFYQIYYKVQTATLTSQSVGYSWTVNANVGLIVDCLKGN